MDPAAHSQPRLSPFPPLPARASIYEVGPRDGLQNEARALPTADKVRLISGLVQAGVKRIEATSFVSPRWIPQLQDAEAVMAQVPRGNGVVYSALVPNPKGLERALAAKVDEAGVFLSATESHSKRNINKSIAEAVAAVRETATEAARQGLRVRAYLSCAFGCPFEGTVEPRQVAEVVKQLADLEFYELALGDTIGVGTPLQTQALVREVEAVVGKGRVALHLHDTRGTALANAFAGLALGVTSLDASLAGLGGCPYAPGAAGNLATEDLVFMLKGLGVETGVSLEELVKAGETAQQLIGRRLPGKYLQAALGERERASSG